MLLELKWFVEDNTWLFILLITIFLGIIAYKNLKK
jgi:hypothetical protein